MLDINNQNHTSPTRIFVEAVGIGLLAGVVATAIGVGVHFGLDKAIDLKTLNAAVGISSAFGGGIWVLYRAFTNQEILNRGRNSATNIIKEEIYK